MLERNARLGSLAELGGIWRRLTPRMTPRLEPSRKAKAVAAGTSESAGTPQPGTRCTRLTKADSFGHLSGGALAALLLAAGGAVAAAIIATTHNNNLNFGGSVTVVSPTK